MEEPEPDNNEQQPQPPINPTQTHFPNHLITYTRKRKNPQFQLIISPHQNPNPNPNPQFNLIQFSYDILNLPDSLLLEIISRLPLKSIFKFNCVSKHWQTLISQPSFPRFYFSRSGQPGSPFRILYKYVYVSKFKDVLDRFRPAVYNSPNAPVLFLSSFEEQQQSDQFKVLGISNGLVLCSLLGPFTYYVCDPVTRQFVTLPTRRDKSLVNHLLFFGEGLVTRVNESNVVTGFSVVTVELLKFRTSFLSLQMFSSDTGKWVGYKLNCGRLIGLMKRGGGPISFNGCLHWFVYDHGMVAFDPYKDPKTCRVIGFPEGRDVDSEYKHDGLYRLCDACCGKLRFFEVAVDCYAFYCFRMWDMKDYENGEWCSAFRVTRSDLSSSDPELNGWIPKATFLPLCFHPLDLDVVYLRCVELACVVSYSIRNKSLDVVAKPVGVVNDLSWRVVIPFVIPRWPTPVPIPPVPKKVVKPKAVHRFRPFRIHNRF